MRQKEEVFLMSSLVHDYHNFHSLLPKSASYRLFDENEFTTAFTLQAIWPWEFWVMHGQSSAEVLYLLFSRMLRSKQGGGGV